MDRFPFLSPPWISAARELRANYVDRVPPPPLATKINVVVTDVPHGSATTIEGHIDTTSGQTVMAEGHVDAPDLTVTLDYETAKAAFVTRDQQALMQSFFSGKILVEGDVSVLMALQGDPPDGDSEGLAVLAEMYEAIGSFTE